MPPTNSMLLAIGRVGALLAAPRSKKQGAASSAPTKCGPIKFANNINSFVDHAQKFTMKTPPSRVGK
ncbi:MAG: hypothetical protein JXQ72_11945 [Anaerolineae bacterium]|nr:hypothetical protein [Anaerolineae bacterium]